jgi:predicted dehydrogenase
MRFLIVGLGSMGKRRIRNLHALKLNDIVGFDMQAERRSETQQQLGIEVATSLEEGLSKRPDAIIISTPPDRHLPFALEAARRNIHFFMEASVLLEGMDGLIAECRGKKIVAAPSSTMRFHPSIQTMKRLVEQDAIGKILAVNYHSGQYLPDWHPWEDYRKYYVSKRETGGCREIVPFELSWITWLLGPVRRVSCMKGKLTKLEADIDDIYQMLLEFNGGAIGSMQVDIISRVPYRSFKMISEEGVIVWDWEKRLVSVYNAASKEWKQYPQEKGRVVEGYVMEDDMYVEEMRHFVGAIEGKDQYMYSLEDDHKILELLYAAEKSSTDQIHVETK